MNDAIARLARLAASLQNSRDFLTQAWDRMAEADALVAEYPAEEAPLSGDECCQVARCLVGDDDLALQFAVFCALMERGLLAEMGPLESGHVPQHEDEAEEERPE